MLTDVLNIDFVNGTETDLDFYCLYHFSNVKIAIFIRCNYKMKTQKRAMIEQTSFRDNFYNISGVSGPVYDSQR